MFAAFDSYYTGKEFLVNVNNVNTIEEGEKKGSLTITFVDGSKVAVKGYIKVMHTKMSATETKNEVH